MQRMTASEYYKKFGTNPTVISKTGAEKELPRRMTASQYQKLLQESSQANFTPLSEFPKPSLLEKTRRASVATGDAIKSAFSKNIGLTTRDLTQSEFDKPRLEAVESMGKSIATLVERNSKEQDLARKQEREKKIQQLLKQQEEMSSLVGGDLAKKTNKQLVGQSAGTALELAPFLGFKSLGTMAIKGAMSTVGKQGAKELIKKELKKEVARKGAGILSKEWGKTAVKASMAEAGLFGVMVGASEEMKEGDATKSSIAWEAIKMGAISTVFAGVMAKGLQKLFKPKKELSKIADEIEDEINYKPDPAERKQLEEMLDTGIEKEEIVTSIKTKERDLSIEVIANLDDPKKIAPLLEGKIAPEDIPTVSRLLKNVESPESANAILKQFDPEIQNQKLIEDISFAETPEQVARFLKGKADEKTIKEISPALAVIQDEADIKRMLDDFNVKAKSIETKIDDVAKKVEEPKPKQTPKQTPKPEVKPKQTIQEDPLIAEARKYKTEKEFMWSKGFDSDPEKQINSMKSQLEKKKKALDKLSEKVSSEINKMRAEVKRVGGLNENEYRLYQAKESDLRKKLTKSEIRYNNEERLVNSFKEEAEKKIQEYSQLSDIYKKAHETPKPKVTPKETPKPKSTPKKQTTFQDLPKKNLELIETTKKIKSKSGQKMLKKVLGDLEAEVKDMPEYGGMDMKEQAEKALRLAIDDYDYAYRIAMGLDNAPKGIKTGSVFNAVKRIAIEKGDIDTLIALGTSPEMNAFKKALGQEVKAFDDTMTDDPTRVIDGIIKAQKEQIANADDLIKAEEKKLKEAINKTQTSPESFIKNILC